MKFYSTNKKSKNFSISEVLRLGLAPDKGLFMPDAWPKLPGSFFRSIEKFKFREMAFLVARQFMKELPAVKLRQIIKAAFNFSVPLKHLGDNIYILELFHGPTMAFKDFGARFLSRSLNYFLKPPRHQLNIIVATSGDTGSAVASGFFKVPNIHVFILYPSGKVSPLQEKQLTTYGRNVVALKVKGTFDDCQRLVKAVLSDVELNKKMPFSSANSINFGRLLPQSFYYFWAVAELKRQKINRPPVIAVPSGNFGNLFAGLMAKKMGLPVKQFIAATNSNNIIPKYLKTGKFIPKPSKKTISNAMDVGSPSNFARIVELYKNNRKAMANDILGFSISDALTKKTIVDVYKKTGYILDPHTAVGVTAALKYQRRDNHYPIIILSTAHPAKFGEIVQPLIGKKTALPRQLAKVAKKRKKSFVLPANFESLKKFLINRK